MATPPHARDHPTKGSGSAEVLTLRQPKDVSAAQIIALIAPQFKPISAIRTCAYGVGDSTEVKLPMTDNIELRTRQAGLYNTSSASRIISRLCRLALIAAFACLVPVAALASQAKPVSHLVARKPIQAPDGAVNLCRQYSWACARSGGAKRSPKEALSVASKVNNTVNARVRAISDRQQYGAEEVWDLPTRRGGDCEDFALLKKKHLVEAGFPPEDLLIATVLDRNRGAHAVLVLRTASGDFVLDNLKNKIHPWRATGYSFLRMQNPRRPNQWVAVFAGGVFGS